MALSRSAQVRLVGGLFQTLAVVCIVVGALVGWVLPRAGLAFMAALSRPVAASGVDSITFLGASLTTLGVIVAILIGYNVAGLQTAGQLMSLALARAMLLSLAPFLLCWTATTGVGLVYLLLPPVYVGQLWQMLVWFGAVVFFMLGYLWTLPWRLSGEYAARWAVDDLRAAPIAQWESQDGYDVLQSSTAAATTRGDLGGVRAMAQTLGGFLVTARDMEAERDNRFDRGRYRALKNLLSGCAQFAGAAPTSVAYQLGHVAAGTLVRAAAIGLPTGGPEYDLFSGLLRGIGDSPDRIDSLWAGARHALFRGDARTDPYLLMYWRLYPTWDSADPRVTQRIADGLMRLHAGALQTLQRAEDVTQAQTEAAHMLDDLYRYVASYLRERIEKHHAGAERDRLLALAANLLSQLHANALGPDATWSVERRGELAAAFDRYQAAFASAPRTTA
ncbi:MAG TPA: hypothetical protein VF812_15970 [Ktedonobacterales bacterium]